MNATQRDRIEYVATQNGWVDKSRKPLSSLYVRQGATVRVNWTDRGTIADGNRDTGFINGRDELGTVRKRELLEAWLENDE
jgi:hypothetical protein